MKKFFIEYINILGYVITGLIFGIAFFLLLFNFYHSKEVSTTFTKGDDYVDVYTKNISTIEQIKNNINSFNANNYRGRKDQLDLVSIKSRLDMCVSSFESTKANDIFKKKEVGVLDVYNLISYYQSDIINDCITLQIYGLSNYISNLNSNSFELIKPFIENNATILSSDLDYVKRNLQNNSSYSFSSDYDKINIFNLTRDSYTRVESSYQNSINLVLEVSKWFNKLIGGEI